MRLRAALRALATATCAAHVQVCNRATAVAPDRRMGSRAQPVEQATLSLWTWLDVLASASCLVVAVFALWPGAASRLRLPLALLAVDQFAWNVSSVSLAMSGDVRYRW